MSDTMYIYNPYNNNNVTEKYIEIVESAFKKSGYNVFFLTKLSKNSNERAGIFVVTLEDAILAKRMKYSPIYTWSQGIIPEESYMRTKSNLRKAILSFLERKGLRSSDYVFYVSKAMENHYIQKYRINNTAYIMPCFDSDINRSSFFTDSKYKNNVFVYAGGAQIWQCLDKTISIYSEVERRVKDAQLLILSKERNAILPLLEKYEVKNYSIDFVDHDKMAEVLKKAKFGFCIREENIVNKVATPTKLSTYVGNGLITVYSSFVEDFGSLAKNDPFCIDIEEKDSIERIIDLCNTPIAPNEVYYHHNRVFGEYFSSNYHIKNICSFIGASDSTN